MSDAKDEPLTPEEQQQIDSLSSAEIEAAADAALSEDEGVIDDSDFKPFYPHWNTLVKQGKLKERTPVKIHPDMKKHVNEYVDSARYVRDELSESTLLWYPPDAEGRRKLMALFLKDVIPVEVQKLALKGLEAMIFKDPTREETKNAITFNGPGAKVRAGELTFGFMDRGSVTKTNPTTEQKGTFGKLEPLLGEMNDCYARTTPQQFGEQNRPYNESKTKDGGIHTEFRNFLTAFSTISVLRSCPAAVHVDRGNGQGYSVLTGVRGKDFEGGGEFCFIEYGLKISVKPGDLLVGATMREWHCNLTPVRGTKFSVICYYRRGLGSIKRREGWAKRQQK